MTDSLGHNSGAVNSGWIRVDRDMLDHPVVGMGQPVKPHNPKRKFVVSRFEAWFDLLRLARWKGGYQMVKGHKTWIDVGQLLGARAWLAERWNWSVQQVRTFLAKLELDGMVSKQEPQKRHKKTNQQSDKKPNNRPNILTICNYSKYQIVENEITQYCNQQNNHRATTEQPHYNKETKDKNLPAHARAQERDPFKLNHYEAQSDYQLDANGRPVILNGERAVWLERFGGDAELDVALAEAAKAINPGSRQPLGAVIGGELARILRLREERERDRQLKKLAASGQRRLAL